MKKFLVLALIALASVFAKAEDIYYVKAVTDGSLVLTNTFNHAWQVSGVSFELPASTTNTFTFKLERPVFTAGQTTVISTNTFFSPAYVETNVYYTANAATWWTNTVYSETTTDLTSRVIGSVDLKDGVHVHVGDIMRFSWSYTNATVYVSIDGESR